MDDTRRHFIATQESVSPKVEMILAAMIEGRLDDAESWIAEITTEGDLATGIALRHLVGYVWGALNLVVATTGTDHMTVLAELVSSAYDADTGRNNLILPP